jgi:hypothetical protein
VHFVAELSLALWLFLIGLDEGKWREQATAAAGVPSTPRSDVASGSGTRSG